MCLFLPVGLMGFALLCKAGQRSLAKVWLVGLSVLFYGWVHVMGVLVLTASILFNYAIAGFLRDPAFGRRRRPLLTVAITLNLGLLGYFKYWNFFLDTLTSPGPGTGPILAIAVPLGLSFLTFQQIAYLVDAYRGQTPGESFLDYSLFISFFPKLSAGPIVRQAEFVPHVQAPAFGSIRLDDLASGITCFALGLFKKVVLADGLAEFANPAFDTALWGQPLYWWDAWGAMLSYTFQLYFDFSGYTDMAIGVARMFGLTLPTNFNLPYRADSIREFWRRWHMTFSRFLRDYLYIPLGGNRLGTTRTYVNLMFTMLLGGLWHGASWTFLIWGGLHGFYLIVNHAWDRLEIRLPWLVAWLLTFLSISFAWIWFRADSPGAALRLSLALCRFEDLSSIGVQSILAAAANLSPVRAYADLAVLLDGLGMSTTILGQPIRLSYFLLSVPVLTIIWLLLASTIAFGIPSVIESTTPESRPGIHAFTWSRALWVGILLVLAWMNLTGWRASEFVYLQF
jgi:D-alanyl-lipoteichoic acid acyltransferase DltB (MBOAT superfamily)